jgi:hypothetical protein
MAVSVPLTTQNISFRRQTMAESTSVNITDLDATEVKLIVHLSDLIPESEIDHWTKLEHYDLKRKHADGRVDGFQLFSGEIAYDGTNPELVFPLETPNIEDDILYLTYQNLDGEFVPYHVEFETVIIPDPGPDPGEVLTRVRNIDTNITTAATILSELNLLSFQAIPDQLTNLEDLMLSVKAIVSQPVNPSLQAIKEELLQAKTDVQDSSPDIEEEEEEHETEWKQTLVINQIALWKGLLPLIQDALNSQDIQTDLQAKLRLLQSDVNASLGYFYGHRNGVEFFTWQQLKVDALGRINTALTRTN